MFVYKYTETIEQAKKVAYFLRKNTHFTGE